MKKILIIDDDFAVLKSLYLLFKRNDFDCYTTDNPDDAMKILKHHEINLVLLDMNFGLSTSGKEGLEILSKIKNNFPNILVILVTAWGSIDLAVKGMKIGAVDFITKPWNNKQLINSIRTALSISQDSDSGKIISRQELDAKYDFSNIIGNNKDLLAALYTAGKVSRTNAPVLITGESGTGKELIADAIHNNSKRRKKLFIKVNLGVIPTSLFESEMFGHKKGAFTDAKSERTGRFELADGGTIFLDEIGELDLNNQVKLLQVLQDKTFVKIGGTKTKTSDFRVICATNKDLQKLVEEKKFREDLFYRINLISIHLPSLRQRRDDIPLLANYFTEQFRKAYDMMNFTFSQKAIQHLKQMPWKGNIRELKNFIEKIAVFSDGNILEPDDINKYYSKPIYRRGEGFPPAGTLTLVEMEEQMIRNALKFYKNNISKVAQSLGLSRGALYRRLEKYSIEYESKE